MKILYGSQGTGNGHLTRTLAVVPRLRAAGADVDLIFSGTESEGLRRDLPSLQPYRALVGVTYTRDKGRVHFGKTLDDLRPRRIAREFATIRGPYNLVITDFEPITAWWGISHSVPVIGLGNHYAFSGDVPRPFVKNPVAETFIRFFAPVDVPVGMHWHRANAFTLPPIIRPEILTATPRRGDHFLIYLPSYAARDVDEVFRRPEFAPYRFVLYPRRDDYAPLGPLDVKPFDADSFVEDLRAARGVVTGGGFTLLSECFHLGKPVYVIPEVNQYEQLCNAEAIKRWKLGATSRRLDAKKLARWLAEPKAAQRRFPDVAAAFARWLVAGQPYPVAQLADELWAAVEPPYKDATTGR